MGLAYSLALSRQVNMTLGAKGFCLLCSNLNRYFGLLERTNVRHHALALNKAEDRTQDRTQDRAQDRTQYRTQDRTQGRTQDLQPESDITKTAAQTSNTPTRLSISPTSPTSSFSPTSPTSSFSTSRSTSSTSPTSGSQRGVVPTSTGPARQTFKKTNFSNPYLGAVLLSLQGQQGLEGQSGSQAASSHTRSYDIAALRR